jgi:activator of HSP90 ATPase
MAEVIHQEIDFAASPKRIYDALMDSKQHAEFTANGAAEISREAGGTFSCHGGAISGRNIELILDKRIVQAWRVANWDEGAYSIVKIELQNHNGGTRLILDHAGFPEGQAEHLGPGWHERYWIPLRKYLA